MQTSCERGVRAARWDRGRIMASLVCVGPLRCRRRSSVEARAGPELRIIDLYWGYVDPFLSPVAGVRGEVCWTRQLERVLRRRWPRAFCTVRLKMSCLAVAVRYNSHRATHDLSLALDSDQRGYGV
eukprot:282176-Prymnesium_polylepis.2